MDRNVGRDGPRTCRRGLVSAGSREVHAPHRRDQGPIVSGFAISRRPRRAPSPLPGWVHQTDMADSSRTKHATQSANGLSCAGSTVAASSPGTYTGGVDMSAEARRRSSRLEFRATPGERDLIERAVAAQGVGITEFVLTQACQGARLILADRREFTLDASAQDAWNELNSRPARDLPGLRRLMARPSPFGGDGRVRVRKARAFTFKARRKGLSVPVGRAD